jgi:hypothetical protein
VYSLEHVMQIQMNKQFGQHSYTFEDINDVHEVWEFVDLSLMPTVIKHKDEVFASLSLSLSIVKYILAPIIYLTTPKQ